MENYEELYTIEEVAKWCNLSRNAAYMHFRRGHISNVPDIKTHRIYFTRDEIDRFRYRYCPFN